MTRETGRAKDAGPQEPKTPRLRPLDRLGSIKMKLGVIIVATVAAASVFTWLGQQHGIGASRTLPLALLGSLLIIQVLARGMTSPLREMTRAATKMAKGDYSTRVTATSNDEVGQLARAFNDMAADLGSVDRARKEMIANVSHELRTPVAALQAQLENMVDGVTEPDEESLSTALAQTERLGRLVAYLLDQSRLEAGAVGLDIRSLALRPFFEEVLDAVTLGSSLSGDAVKWAISVSPPGLTVPVDQERLYQVVFNLAQNAARHSPPGGTVTVSARRRAEQVIIEVSDEGPGIPPDQREAVFERFVQAGKSSINPAARTASTGGTGLGLSISRWAVEMHHGTIAVANTTRGCTIRVVLPANRPRPGSAQRT